jgi:hypothetical protein
MGDKLIIKKGMIMSTQVYVRDLTHRMLSRALAKNEPVACYAMNGKERGNVQSLPNRTYINLFRTDSRTGLRHKKPFAVLLWDSKHCKVS